MSNGKRLVFLANCTNLDGENFNIAAVASNLALAVVAAYDKYPELAEVEARRDNDYEDYILA